MTHLDFPHLLRALLAVGLTSGVMAAQDKKKDGPAYKVTAAKYKGKAA